MRRRGRQSLTPQPGFAIVARMTTIKLDLAGLKCPLPALRTGKALKSLAAGTKLEVVCTDPMAAVDIPVMVQKSGDRVARMTRQDERIVFLIEKI